MVNLLSNALKFTSFGEIRLDVDEIGIKQKKYNFKIFRKDTGLGIKVENKEKIFNSFVQEDSTNRKFEGLVRSCDFKSLALMDSKLQLISMYGDGSDSLKLNLKSSKLK
jgi:K+-sensing histidine kinase KdpD